MSFNPNNEKKIIDEFCHKDVKKCHPQRLKILRQRMMDIAKIGDVDGSGLTAFAAECRYSNGSPAAPSRFDFKEVGDE